MARSLVLAVALVASVALTPAATGSGKRSERRPCSLGGSYTLYRDDAVRIYEKAFDDDTRYETYACLYAVDRRRRIAEFDEWYGGESLALVSVRRPRIAYTVSGGNKAEGTYGFVCILNLRTGHRHCELTDDGGGLGVGLTRRGSIAWMDAPQGACCTVHKLDAGRAKPVVLDSGTDIDRDSFAVGGRHVYWTKAGSPRSSTMP